MPSSDPLTAFRLWARIEHSGPNEFLAIVTAVPENGDPALVRVLRKTVTSRESAQAAARRLLKEMGRIVRDNEGRITDVETDGI